MAKPPLFTGPRPDAKITCLCPTHGRITRLRESLACFLSQDAPTAKMLIYNFHPVPLRLAEAYHNVELVNEDFEGDVHEMWARLLTLVDTPFMHPWYDDDFYLPWATSQGLLGIGKYKAYKPRFFYQMVGVLGQHTLSKNENVGEGSMTFQTRHARQIGLQDSDALWTPHLYVTDVLPSWVFRWSDGVYKSEGISRDYTRKERDKLWRAQNQDVDDGLLHPTSINEYWKAIAAFDPDAAAVLDRYIDNSEF
jgi:hypothetical protein